MSRTLQRTLLVAAMASAPLVATASPDRPVTSDEPSFFQRVFAKLRESAQQAAQQPTPATPTPARTSAQQTSTAPSMENLPRWLKAFFDADAASGERARSTGS